MRKKAARMMCISMTCLILCSFSGKVYASTISEIRRQQEEDKKKLNNVQGQISGLQGEQSEIGAEIDEIDAELVQIIASVDLGKGKPDKGNGSGIRDCQTAGRDPI